MIITTLDNIIINIIITHIPSTTLLLTENMHISFSILINPVGPATANINVLFVHENMRVYFAPMNAIFFYKFAIYYLSLSILVNQGNETN